MAGRPVVLCPLEIERRVAAARAYGRAEIVRTGPGGENVARVVDAVAPASPPLIALFGVAGGLVETARAPVIAAALDAQTGERFQAPAAPGDGGVTIAGVDEPVCSLEAKRELAERTGAELVDCESHAFARACDLRGLRWCVIRGVSDGPQDALPAQSVRWVDAKGRTRLRQVLLDAALAPSLIPALWSMRRAATDALDDAANLLAAMLEQHAGGTIDAT